MAQHIVNFKALLWFDLKQASNHILSWKGYENESSTCNLCAAQEPINAQLDQCSGESHKRHAYTALCAGARPRGTLLADIGPLWVGKIVLALSNALLHAR